MLINTGNPNSETENPKDNDENRRFPSPLSALMPLENPDGYCMIKERITQALRYFKDSTEQHVLAQVWVPVKVGGRYVLTTSGQPFVLDPHSNGLHQYRMVSLMYMFSVDGESDGELGLPGRVFWQKLPEWTPNVQYYSSKEYSRLDHALHHNVRGTMALPVFEPSGQSCVAVIELIMTSQKINYAPEVDKVCKALEVGFSPLASHIKSDLISYLMSSAWCYLFFYFLWCLLFGKFFALLIMRIHISINHVTWFFAEYVEIYSSRLFSHIISVFLQAVNLKSSEILDYPSTQVS